MTPGDAGDQRLDRLAHELEQDKAPDNPDWARRAANAGRGRAGVDHSTIHHHFPTKEALVVAVVDHATGQFRSTTPPNGSPADRLRGHLTTLRQKINDQPELHVVLRELDLRARRDPELREIIASREEGWRTSLRALPVEAAADGALTASADPAAGAELIIAAVKGASLAPDRSGGWIRGLFLLPACRRLRVRVRWRACSPQPTPTARRWEAEGSCRVV